MLRYRLPPEDPWPAARDDMEAAVYFLRSAAGSARYHVDPDKIMVLGFSAGAHLSAHAFSPRLKACVLVYPGHHDVPGKKIPTTQRAVAEAKRAGDDRSSLPSLYVVASTTDFVCSPTQHVDPVVRELRDAGLDCKSVFRRRDAPLDLRR